MRETENITFFKRNKGYESKKRSDLSEKRFFFQLDALVFQNTLHCGKMINSLMSEIFRESTLHCNLQG